MDSQSSCVVVTGFGPFRQHLVNSSWEAVKELSKLGLNSGMEVELRILQLPVDYREVKQRVTRIWEDLQPQLAVHVGLDASAKAILLERRAKNRGYRDADVRGFRPARGECLPGGPEVVASGVIARAASQRAAPEGVAVAVSGDAGRYVCEYTYYLSLHHGNGRAALIHVPPLSHWLPASVLGKALQVIIQDMLEEMRKPELKAWFAENSTSVIPAQGGQLGDCLFREN
ncbi:pyroglutamyl-peptidase 1-like protein [Canis lupus baileyi]|nr:pyroglutamyl-peptidase 1-like protein isoform X2 [Canis lupus familiaris]XP_025293868.1 pyroglutamyl-peptidase 1-like protein [Canis lupus dingo]XP_038388649.1 pyroglutamyl-peptidase 1-like protein isoform X2 [Canis lupus familiaris]XP_038517160.1 pyroglutamyl-peptidase 1-like protein isoform X2 [Canis lupus familiaris]|eukprot:XP_022272597.1 pyroglutamyl-peptidase 1-like protein isoform X1 [Canis lupus familiaris]